MKKFITVFLFVMTCFIMGCSKEKSLQTFSYRTSGEDIVKSFYLVNAEYYEDKVVIQWDGTIKSVEDYHFSEDSDSAKVKVKGHTITFYLDKPKEFDAFSMWPDNDYEDRIYRFRYLDTDQYACLYTSMDSEGGTHESGSVDRYYTEEEKASYSQSAKEAAQEQLELFEMLEGKWVCEDGDYFLIYAKDLDAEGNYAKYTYHVEYSLGEESGIKNGIWFESQWYAREGIIGIAYDDGPYETAFMVTLSENQNSFVYEDKIFNREMN